MTTSVVETLSSADIAESLHVSEKLLQRIRKLPDSPFEDGVHFRYQSITTASPSATEGVAPLVQAFSDRSEPWTLQTQAHSQLHRQLSSHSAVGQGRESSPKPRTTQDLKTAKEHHNRPLIAP